MSPPAIVVTAHASNGENRTAVRFPASAVPSITGLSLSPHGAEAMLVNISTTGLLAECGVRLKTGSTVRVNFEGGFLPRTVEGRVARASVGSMTSNGIRYHVGIAFDEAIALEGVAGASVSQIVAAVAEQASEPVLVNRW